MFILFITFLFSSFTLYPHSRHGEPGNLVFFPNNTLSFPTFHHLILEELRIEWRYSTPNFVTLADRENENNLFPQLGFESTIAEFTFRR